MDDTRGLKIAGALILLVVAIVLILVLLPFKIIGAGERGVVMSYGKVSDTILGEGLHWRTPFVQTIKSVSVKTRTTKIDGVAGSSDSQVVTFTAQVNWRMNPNTVNTTYQQVGDERSVEDNYIVTKGPDAIKESISKTTAVDFQRNRETVRNLAVQNLKKRMGNTATIEDISFTNIDFSKEFNNAIEAKVTAEQEAQAQKNKLESIKYQAQQKIETAKAEAESIKIRNEALSSNPALTEYTKAQRWDGHLPTTIVGGGTVPFFDINK